MCMVSRSRAGAGSFIAAAVVSQAPPPAPAPVPALEVGAAGSRLPELTLQPRGGFNPSGLGRGVLPEARLEGSRLARRWLPAGHLPGLDPAHGRRSGSVGGTGWALAGGCWHWGRPSPEKPTCWGGRESPSARCFWGFMGGLCLGRGWGDGLLLRISRCKQSP